MIVVLALGTVAVVAPAHGTVTAVDATKALAHAATSRNGYAAPAAVAQQQQQQRKMQPHQQQQQNKEQQQQHQQQFSCTFPRGPWGRSNVSEGWREVQGYNDAQAPLVEMPHLPPATTICGMGQGAEPCLRPVPSGNRVPTHRWHRQHHWPKGRCNELHPITSGASTTTSRRPGVSLPR